MPSDREAGMTVEDVLAELDALSRWNRQLWLFACPVLMVFLLECAP